MQYSLWLLRLEVITFLIFLFYVIYYLYFKFYNVFNWLYKIVGSWKVKKEIISSNVNKIEIKEDRNLHVKNYSKDKVIKDEDKIKIGELLKKIKINISKGEYDLAKNLVVEWLVIDKFNIELNLELASIYIFEKDYIKAEYIYKDLLLVHSEDFEILKKLAYILTMQQKYDLAIEMYKKAYDIKNDDFEIINMLAHLYYYKKEFSEAINYLRIFLKQSPRDVDNLVLMWDCLKSIWKFQDSINVFKRALELQPYNEYIKKEIEEIEAIVE